MLFSLPMSCRQKKLPGRTLLSKVFFPADVLLRKVKEFFSEGHRQVMHIFPTDVLLRTLYEIFSQFEETF